ncbi:MAG TPA: N-acetyltransferase [Thermodesulfobium narugense]|nr:MAG: GNAT family N-acetyltransferase [Thermodesulfobium narugense]HEM55274.1 N-acetyltransferase [Thermodesulfobium narugense]
MIRKARIDDAKVIKALIESFAKQNLMLIRPLSDIYESIRDFCVLEIDDKICGCGALHIFWEDIAEIRSLCVNSDYQKRGLGKEIVNFLIEEARQLKLKKVFALTYQVVFFKSLGFEILDKSHLPQKIWSECVKCPKFPDCDEVAMIRKV